MTTHELAKKLLAGPDVPVCVNEPSDSRPIEIGDIFEYDASHKYRGEDGSVARQSSHIVLS